MTYVLVGIACLAVGAGIAALFFRRELRRMAGFLRGREARSNARMTVEAPGRAFAELAEAVNAQLDAAQQERLDGQRRQQEFQRDLASLSHDIRTPLMGAKGYLRLAQDEGDEVGRARRLAAAEARLDDMGALLDQLFAYAQANDPDLALDLAPVAVLPALADVLVGQSSRTSWATRCATVRGLLRWSGAEPAWRSRTRCPTPPPSIPSACSSASTAPTTPAARPGAASASPCPPASPPP